MLDMDGITMGVRVLLVTGRQAEGIVRSYAEQAAAMIPGVEVDVVALDIPTASLITTDFLVRNLPRKRPDYKRFDIIMVPGSSLVDPVEAGRRLGVRVVKGPRSAGELEHVLRLIAGGDERIDYSDVGRSVLEVVSKVFEEAEKLCVDSACVRRHPAYTIVVEVAPMSGIEFEELLDEVVARKPDFIVLGDEEYLERDEFRRLLRLVVERVDRIPFGVESRHHERRLEALEYGARLVAGVSPSLLREYRRYREDAFFVLVPFDETRGLYPRDSHEKVELLIKGLEEAGVYGFKYVILDPVITPPPMGFTESLEPYRVLRDASLRYGSGWLPLLFSLGSIEDAVPTDPFPVYLLGSLIGYELGASVYWVVAKRGVEVDEARVALDVALASYVKKSFPSELGIDLTLLGTRSGQEMPIDMSGDVVVVDGEVPPSKLDPGYARIMVKNGEIIVEYVEGGRRRVYRGKDGLSIARLITRDFNVSPEHAAYLGYELARAEIAAKLRGGYTQDERAPPPYERLRG